jgi:hypothetical protein
VEIRRLNLKDDSTPLQVWGTGSLDRKGNGFVLLIMSYPLKLLKAMKSSVSALSGG